MPERINWKMDVQVSGGPKIKASQTLTVEAYDKIEVSLAVDASAEDVWVQPGTVVGQVKILVIKSSKYSDTLTYSVNDTEDNAENRIKLDALQVLIGDGAVGLLGETPPQSLYFYNETGEEITIQILVGRKATTE